MEIKVKLIPRKYIFSFSLSYLYSYFINCADDLSHSFPHRYFTPNYTFAFAFVVLKVINSDIIVFRFALISVSMVSGHTINLMRCRLLDQREAFACLLPTSEGILPGCAVFSRTSAGNSEALWPQDCLHAFSKNLLKVSWSETPKRGRKIGAARKMSRSVEKLFDDFWLFVPCANVEKCRNLSWHFLIILDVFWRGPLPLAPFAVRWI